MSRDYQTELDKRTDYIRSKLAESGATGIIFGNSGGKDSALVGILCKHACPDTVGVTLPCHSKQNFGSDMTDAGALSERFGIEMRSVDLSSIRDSVVGAVEKYTAINDRALINIAPRLRMITLYSFAAAENRLVAGTGNRSEVYMGYFTKWGDGAFDFNPIGDLTVGEVYEFLRFLGAPESIISKAPSAGLYEGQTDEADMGVSYAAVDRYIVTGEANPSDLSIIERYHRTSEHKRKMPSVYGG